MPATNASIGPGETTIRAINERMHDEETRGIEGVPFFSALLDQMLRFRRANGAIVTRDEFLIDLADARNHRESIGKVGELECHLYEDTAVVSVLLAVRGSNRGESIDGLYRNVRIFHRAVYAAPWLLAIWFNERVGDVSAGEQPIR